MADDSKDRGKTEEGDDEEEAGAEGAAEEPSDDEPEAEGEEQASEDDGADEDQSSGEAEASGDDASASRVADALGVGEAAEDAEKAEGAATEAAVQNRAARRREEALERRKKRRGGVATPAADETDRAKDKNERAKELLLKRRERAKGPTKPSVQSALLPSEMVDDALSRTAASFGKWFRSNWNVIQWVVVAVVVGGGGFAFWQSQRDKTAGNATSQLATAIAAERGRVLEEDKRSDEEKEYDPTRIFKTAEERSEAAFAGYTKVISEHPKSGAAILARLGQAGVHLDRKQWDQALEAYSAVIASTLAAADPDVKGRAIEGAALAKEGKGDVDAALASFKELEGIDAKGFKELALYHQARLHLGKGDKDKAKELLKSAREKLTAPGADTKPFPFLEAMVDEMLRRIDPSAVPARTTMPQRPGGGTMSPEELEKLIQRAREAAEKKGGPDAPPQ